MKKQNKTGSIGVVGATAIGVGGMILISIAALVAPPSAVNSTMFGDNNVAIRSARIEAIPSQFGVMTEIGGTWGLFILH